MSSTTLSKLDSTQLDSSGNGTITLRPDVGQNWAPLFVRVSSNIQATPVPYCAVYHGSPGVSPQSSQFIDDTFLGNGDSSSMIAGTPVLYGQAIIFQFKNGTPNDIVTASVFGMQSDLPPNLDLVPQVPGTHFAGHLNTEITSVLAQGLALPFTLVLLPGAAQSLGVFDVRQFASYYLKIFTTTGIPATAFNSANVSLTWRSTNVLTNNGVFQDFYEWWSDSPGPGAFTTSLGIVEIQDTMHGPYMDVVITNNSATDNINVSFLLMASTRILSEPFVRQQAGIDGVLLNIPTMAIGAGATQTQLAPLLYGRAFQKLQNNGANTLTFNIYYGSLGPPIIEEQFVIAAGTADRRDVILPKRALRVDILAPGGASSYVIYIGALFDKV